MEHAVVYDFDTHHLTNGQRADLYRTLLVVLRGQLGYRRRQYSFYIHSNKTRAQVQNDILAAIVQSPLHSARIQQLDVFEYDPVRANWTNYARGAHNQPPP